MGNKVYIAASLDGFIADETGGLEWLTGLPNPEESDFGFSAFMAGVDAVVMGRNTFETVAAFAPWPYDKPVFVLSSRSLDVSGDLRDKVERLDGDVAAIVERLNGRGYVDLYIDGGKTIQTFLRADRIDEMTITWVSVLLGKGIPLFGALGVTRAFTLVETTMLTSHLVKQRYVRTATSGT